MTSLPGSEIKYSVGIDSDERGLFPRIRVRESHSMSIKSLDFTPSSNI